MGVARAPTMPPQIVLATELAGYTGARWRYLRIPRHFSDRIDNGRPTEGAALAVTALAHGARERLFVSALRGDRSSAPKKAADVWDVGGVN